MLSSGLSRLKGLGIGMNEEITRQNKQLDTLLQKTDDNDSVLKDQNRQVRRLLWIYFSEMKDW